MPNKKQTSNTLDETVLLKFESVISSIRFYFVRDSFSVAYRFSCVKKRFKLFE